MKKLVGFAVSAIALLVSQLAVASHTTGLYAGVQVGYAFNDWKKQVADGVPGSFAAYSSTNVTRKKNGTGSFASGINLGYMLTSNIGVELGYDYFGRPKITTDDLDSSGVKQGVSYVTVKQQAVTLLGVGRIPLTQSLAVLTKIGVAELFTQMHYQETTASGSSTVENIHGTEQETVPVFGVGAEYRFPSLKNLGLNLSAEHFFYDRNTTWGDAGGNETLDIQRPSVTFVSMGVSYNF